MRALYVDLPGDEIWTRPIETSLSDAFLMVSAASIEYGVRRQKFATPKEAVVIQAVGQMAGLLPALPEAPTVNWPNH